MQAYTTYILSISSSFRHRNIYSPFWFFSILHICFIYNVDYFSPLICGTDNLDIELPNFCSDELKAGVLRRKCNRMIISIGVHSQILKMYHLAKRPLVSNALRYTRLICNILGQELCYCYLV